jgi:Zn finger protein HypA/HybF involved in hydrogenase expression
MLTAAAQNIFEKLVMPGPLVEGHAKLEKNCANCHESFTKASQSRLCLACHKDVAKDRELRRGLHGKRNDTSELDCKSCHTDHKGRDADIVQFDRETFNHVFTNFQLNEAHKNAACEGCHLPKVKFRNAPSRCIDCHRNNDPHKGRLGDRCQSCHGEDNWTRVRTFDHSKTHFPLTGSHQQAACSSCHANEKYKGTPTVCSSCHQLQDVHQGRYGAKCETCHDATKWKTVRFDHARMTKFPLRGKHATTRCEACHTGDLYKEKLGTTCISCHKQDDAHAGKLGTACQQCHNETGWRKKVAFDHDLSRFPLLGQHAIVPCEECHKSTSYKDAPTACSSCHRDAHHEGRLGANCASCHTPNGWAIWRFDHSKQTHFPLTGAHAGLTCASCHREKNVAKISLPGTCYSCHANDDAHQGNFGRACEKCHNTTSFR